MEYSILFPRRGRFRSVKSSVVKRAVGFGTMYTKRAILPLCVNLLMIFALFADPGSMFGSTSANYIVSLDRAGLPPLNYADVTLQMSVGDVSTISLLEDGTETLPYQYDAGTGLLTFTTDGASVQMTLNGPDAASFGGQVNITPLKDDKQVAWSHGMDDNVYLEESVDVFDSYGYRGTVYVIGQHISDTRDQDWILDKIDFHELLGKGWAMGNHTYDHGCYGVDYEADILAGYNRLVQLLPDSPKPNYQINSFAAPCFDSNYHPYILQHRDAGTTETIFNESGNDTLLVVDPNSVDFTSNGRTAKAFNFDMAIGRDHAIELNNPNEAIAIVDWMATYASSTQHFWYNTYSHGGKEGTIGTVMAYVHANYGAAGDQSIWVAPAEEIYAYLLMRDTIAISVSGGPSGTPTPTPIPPTPTTALVVTMPSAAVWSYRCAMAKTLTRMLHSI